MKTIALIGSSGTGKSHHALWVAHENNTETLIDDGLLIKGHEIMAGISAKKQTTAIGAIKTALFSDIEHAEQVKKELRKLNPQSLLILGTSREMVDRIATRLEIPGPSTYIDISEISSEKEIEIAKTTRQQFGKHVIPAPTVAVKPRLSGVLMDPLQVGFSKKHYKGARNQLWVNQTVVQPTFNFYGKFFIADSALQAIIKNVTRMFDCIVKVQNITFGDYLSGTTVSLDLTIYYGTVIPTLTTAIQNKIKSTLEHMTALHITRVDIYVRRIIIPD